ncbi:hypothetical protein Taro_034188 [Colocasia esculenta]|uniref:Uncharacterized protein n=1 Tax=Colocasia esculenta TaxID=4460 RepID=A0A843W987_COLES|nr:hypothetical protein [Colocasia esculenta]
MDGSGWDGRLSSTVIRSSSADKLGRRDQGSAVPTIQQLSCRKSSTQPEASSALYEIASALLQCEVAQAPANVELTPLTTARRDQSLGAHPAWLRPTILADFLGNNYHFFF